MPQMAVAGSRAHTRPCTVHAALVRLGILDALGPQDCLRCHVVGEEGGSEAGPALDGVGDRLTREELLRSVVEPNAQIAAGYESWLLSLDDGEVLSGRILEETEELVVVETSKKEVWEVPPGEITARRRDVSAMPADLSRHLSRAEMRDLVAFLASLRD